VLVGCMVTGRVVMRAGPGAAQQFQPGMLFEVRGDLAGVVNAVVIADHHDHRGPRAAVEGAGGRGHLLARQLLSAGERVLDVPPKLAARVRLLATGDINKNDPDDARSVAVAALRSAQVREVRRDDHAAVLKVRSLCRYRHKDHYSDTAVMPIPAAQVLAGGGGRARDIGIITGLPGRPAARRAAGSGPAGLPAGWSGQGLAA